MRFFDIRTKAFWGELLTNKPILDMVGIPKKKQDRQFERKLMTSIFVYHLETALQSNEYGASSAPKLKNKPQVKWQVKNQGLVACFL